MTEFNLEAEIICIFRYDLYMFAPAGYRVAPGYLTGALRPSAFHIPYLVLGDERWGRREVTPFHQTSVALVEVAEWLAFVSCLPATVFEYGVRLHRHNDSAVRLARLSHIVLFRYQVDVDAAYLGSLDDFVAKVFYVQGECSRELLAACRAMHVPPIVIYDSPLTLDLCCNEGLSCWTLDLFSIPQVRSAIGELFQIPRERLRDLGFSEASTDAATAWSEFPEAFRLGETHFEPYPCSGQRYLFPNEVLINRLRGRLLPPAPAGPPDRADAVRLVTASTELAFTQKLLDYIHENEDDAHLEPDLAGALSTYRGTPNNEHYRELLTCCSPHIHEYGPTQNCILCTPATNHAVIYNILKGALPNRILKYLFRKKTDDYLTMVEPQDIHSAEDFQTVMALLGIQGGENAFLTAVLALHALAARMPTIRTPQMPSTLFTKLRLLTKHEIRNNSSAFGIRMVTD